MLIIFSARPKSYTHFYWVGHLTSTLSSSYLSFADDHNFQFTFLFPFNNLEMGGGGYNESYSGVHRVLLVGCKKWKAVPNKILFYGV